MAHEVLQPDLLEVPRTARPSHASRHHRCRHVSLVLRLRRSRRLRETPGEALHTRDGGGAGGSGSASCACLPDPPASQHALERHPGHGPAYEGRGRVCVGGREQNAASGQLEGSGRRIYRSKGAVSQSGAGLRGMEGARWSKKPWGCLCILKPLEELGRCTDDFKR